MSEPAVIGDHGPEHVLPAPRARRASRLPTVATGAALTAAGVSHALGYTDAPWWARAAGALGHVAVIVGAFLLVVGVRVWPAVIRDAVRARGERVASVATAAHDPSLTEPAGTMSTEQIAEHWANGEPILRYRDDDPTGVDANAEA